MLPCPTQSWLYPLLIQERTSPSEASVHPVLPLLPPSYFLHGTHHPLVHCSGHRTIPRLYPSECRFCEDMGVFHALLLPSAQQQAQCRQLNTYWCVNVRSPPYISVAALASLPTTWLLGFSMARTLVAGVWSSRAWAYEAGAEDRTDQELWSFTFTTC